MKEMYDLFAEASPVLMAITALEDFLKVWMEKGIESVEDRISEIVRTVSVQLGRDDSGRGIG